MVDLNERIYLLVRQIPRGQVTTYGQLALMCGISDSRIVGEAMNASHGLPWQRVINSRGEISIQGATGVRQRQLLVEEGVVFDADGRVDLAEVGWTPDPEWLKARGYHVPPPFARGRKRKSADQESEGGEQLSLF